MWKTIKRVALRSALYPVFWRYVSMPGRSYAGRLPELTALESETAERLRQHVDALAVDIGVRHASFGDSLRRSCKYVMTQLIRRNYAVTYEPFQFAGVTQCNVVSELVGRRRPNEIIVVGAHYDTVSGSAGADDNASGVASLIELAGLLKDANLDRTVRFVAFPNEEYSGEDWRNMGSYHHARASHEKGDRFVGMISLEMLGYFDEKPDTQHYPFPFNLFYPSQGNFIGFVGNDKSRSWVHKVVRSFRRHVKFPSEGAAPPERFSDISRSDHWAFWQFGCPALMITDTSNFRYPHLHTMEDTPDKLDFASMARITVGLSRVLKELANR